MRLWVTSAVALLLASPVSGHHSDAALDLDTLVTLEGTVTEFSWRNPHVYFTVETADERGQPKEWTVQMASTATVSRMGWTRESLAVGERVTIGAYPARDGRPYAKFLSIEKADGIAPPTSFDSAGEVRLAAPEVTASTSTPEGRWMADTDKLVGVPGRLDGLTRASLTLTEKAQAAQAAYDENSAENPELSCIGRPTPGMIVYTDLYPIEIEFNDGEQTIAIRGQFFDEERTVFMDGRGHPVASERYHEGHSIGWWEGETLVVDTTNFTDHRSPYQNGIPSGAQKHVVERYRLIEKGTRMIVEFTLEDPEYIVGSMTHSRELIYSPQADMSPFNCDPESTSRFLPGER